MDKVYENLINEQLGPYEVKHQQSYTPKINWSKVFMNPVAKPIKSISKQSLFYLATPYSKYEEGIEAAYQDAASMLGFLLTKGWHIFCPIVHSHTMSKFDFMKPFHNHNFWLNNVDKPFLDKCDGIIVCKMAGWKESTGIDWEINYMTAKEKPILYTNWMEEPVIDS